jgi:hypothetical protein
MLNPVGDHILQAFNILYMTTEPTELLDHPKQKPWMGVGLRQIKSCRKVPLHVNFFR